MERRPSDTQNKLLLLYAVDRLGAVTAQQLLSFMVENELMDYIAMQLGLAELDDAGLLRKRAHELGTLYALTREGRRVMDLFMRRVPNARLVDVDKHIDRWRQKFRREKQILSSFEETEGGEYVVHLRLLEWQDDLLDLRLKVPTHKHAQRFTDAWVAQAPGIYAYLVHALGEGELDITP